MSGTFLENVGEICYCNDFIGHYGVFCMLNEQFAGLNCILA